jgi:2-oxoglutarate dehydrogenase E1 component
VLPESLLTGDNAEYLDQQYQAWLSEPSAVDERWRALFESFERPSNGVTPGSGPKFSARSIFAGRPSGSNYVAWRESRVAQLINAYRVRGHLKAAIDPLQRREAVEHPELTLPYYGMNDDDLDTVVSTHPLYGMPATARIGDIIPRLEACYCGSIGAEFMNLLDLDQKQWVLKQLETLPDREVIRRETELRILGKLCDAENFERMLHTRFPGTKRFSLEGGETFVPLMDLVIQHSARHGFAEVVVGMAHRGRLNTLVNILDKPPSHIVEEFQDVQGSTQGSGDVKYHKGYSADLTTVDGKQIHVSLTPNPSHLEAVDPVVQGRVRAKQDRGGDQARERCLALLIHGDAAFAGQGLVSETLNLSELAGYRTGGTVHIVINNQIGFTTAPSESRSTLYATDVARMLAVPIFHVNGEDPRAVAAVVEIALAWRQRFKRDVVIDMYCYRKHGHNEGDEPSFTQPQLYEQIRSRPSPARVYAERLVTLGDVSQADVDAVYENSYQKMLAASEPVGSPQMKGHRLEAKEKTEDPDASFYTRSNDAAAVSGGSRDADLFEDSSLKGLWDTHTGATLRDKAETAVDADRLRELLAAATQLPEGFQCHRKITRLLGQRREMSLGSRPMDWSMGEIAAFASLLKDGYSVRLSGQDCGRGTFSHRHAVFMDVKTGEETYPLKSLFEGQPRFDAIDSSLSEAGVMGFEVGYAFDTPDGLVIWEAQFGDFANGAQIIIDQFISASVQKWHRNCGLVLLLPHGYEGQGPEHSSGRIERFLMMCAEDNMRVANVTTPVNFFHLLRRQMLVKARAPLIIMTPKSLLRHPKATSDISEFSDGAFQRVVDDPFVSDSSEVSRVIFCSGKIYYELQQERETRQLSGVAVVRVELLYPFPSIELLAILEKYSDAELVWCQEEPKNMGAWPLFFHWFHDVFPADRIPSYAGRRAAAAPATGSATTHREEQATLIAAALGTD